MPKSSKKKKDKAADFSKAKLKLGKGKQLADNAVDTSFKARSIALPSQNIAREKDNEAPTTRRRLNFDDLIAHLKHYNSGTRKDAILGLRELLEAYPEVIQSRLTALINSCVRVIGDEDASVRKTLLSFLSWLLRQIPPEDLIPHSPVLLLFTTSAQTHIFPEIRIDAVRFLDLFLEHIPSVITEGWMQDGNTHGRRVLEGYLGVLNAGTIFGEGGDSGPARATSTASVVLSLASKLVVLRSLSSFITHGLSSPTYSFGINGASSSSSLTPTWYFSPFFASSEAFERFDSTLRPIHHPVIQAASNNSYASAPTREWKEEVDADDEYFSGSFTYASAPVGAAWSLQDLMDIDVQLVSGNGDSGPASVGSSEIEKIAHIARTLHSTLVSTLLDSTPSVFSPSSSPPETELHMVLVLCEISRSLYGAILRQSLEISEAHDRVVEDLEAIIGYLAPYFPFTIGGAGTARRDIKIEQTFQDLNLIFCELTSFLILALPKSAAKHPPARRSNLNSRGKQRAPSAHASSLQVERVSEYVVRLLRGAAHTGAALSRPITAAAYTALLPTVWALINSNSPGAGDGVLRAVAEHAVKASSTSVVKRHTVDFLGRLILLERESQYRGVFAVGRSSGGDGDGHDDDKKLEEWVTELPKTLWELGAAGLPTTETILRVLLRACQRRAPLLRPETRASLRARLVPYFVITHAVRGRLPGPFARLPPASPLRRLVLDVVLAVGEGAGADGLEPAVDEAVRGTAEAAYWAAGRLASVAVAAS